MTARYMIGDTREILAGLEPGSVDLVLTSPPFYALRSYLPADHPDKVHEIGSEQSPGEFLDALLDVTELLGRVLAPHGSIAIELGDTYAGSGGAGGDYQTDGLRDGQPAFTGSARRDTGPLDKSLCLIPELFRLALAYGRNPLTGRETERWRVRNVVRWHRPNPPVGALGDKYRPATSDMVVACKARDRWFDLDAVRTSLTSWRAAESDGRRAGERDGRIKRQVTGARNDDGKSVGPCNPAGAPPLDTWIIPTAPYKGSHYATYPPALCVRPILSMCPERVCTTCGQPSRRIIGDPEYATGDRHTGNRWASGIDDGRGAHSHKADGATTRVDTTIGWTDCGHGTWRRGIVLDPFAGSGTTLAVAEGHARDSIGIDLDPRNAELARARVGMFLEIHDPAGAR